jgi:hypothetical protein
MGVFAAMRHGIQDYHSGHNYCVQRLLYSFVPCSGQQLSAQHVSHMPDINTYKARGKETTRKTER